MNRKSSLVGITKRKRRDKNKPNESIKKLFDNLRNETVSQHGIIDTIIEIEDSVHNCNETVMIPNVIQDINNTPNKIVRSDINSCPLQCSTPKNGSNNNELVSTFNEVENNFNAEMNDSLVTIDLTGNTTVNITSPSVIDLANESVSKDSNISMSGESDVTIINVKSSRKRQNNGIKNFIDNIDKLDLSTRGQLLKVIAQKMFSGCEKTENSHRIHNRIGGPVDSAEDAYIKEVILRKGPSRNSIGSNIYNPDKDIRNRTGLRMIIIDGSNVAMQHTKGRVFSVNGLKICIEYFVRRGHLVKAFVPHFRCKLGKSTDGKLLDQLERQAFVVYTPSREIQGRCVASYDDRYIVQCAAEFDGVIVSTDNFRDLLAENPRWRFIIENRLLPFTWVNDMIMFPRDPLGRTGPTLEEFLRHPSPIEIT